MSHNMDDCKIRALHKVIEKHMPSSGRCRCPTLNLCERKPTLSQLHRAASMTGPQTRSPSRIAYRRHQPDDLIPSEIRMAARSSARDCERTQWRGLMGLCLMEPCLRKLYQSYRNPDGTSLQRDLIMFSCRNLMMVPPY